MPQPYNPQLPNVPNIPIQDATYKFDGQWMPDLDPALLGPSNFATLENLRYIDGGVVGVNGYTKINTTALTTYVNILNGAQLRSTNTQKTYTLVHATDGSQGRVYVNRTDIGDQGDFDTTHNFDSRGTQGSKLPYYEDTASGLVGRFSKAPQGNLAYANSKETMIFGGDESPVAAAFLIQDTNGTNPIDVTDKVNNSITTEYATMAEADYDYMVVLTTRPIQSFKFYINAGATAGAVVTYYWNGAGWTATANSTDNTTGLSVTGTVTFDHTDTTCKLFHFEELFLYGYLIELNTVTATSDIYRITVDTAFQSVKDVWDGVYRQPIQYQVYDSAAGIVAYNDYTLHVNAPSTTAAPVGGVMSGMTIGDGTLTTDHMIMMFDEQVSGVRFTMLGTLSNENASVMVTSYWNGSAWTVLTLGTNGWADGTITSSKSLGKTGLVVWTPPTDEEPRNLFSSFGYAYKFHWITANISGTKDSTDATDDVLVDICAAVPMTQTIKPFDFTAEYQNRLMLCSYSEGNQGNRIDYSVTNAPDVYNGSDSSDSGRQSLYFGGDDKVTAARSLYNRFGSNILSMFLVLKDSETYLLTGSSPSDFTIYPVSKVVGCPAPLTLDTSDITIGDSQGQSATRNMAFWLSGKGPVMFDGGSITKLRGIENFFEPDNDEYIEWDSITKARGWIDSTYNEYNLLIPSTEGQTQNNKWLVYDLLRRKWFEKTPGTSEYPQSGWEVITEEGEHNVYGGIDTGYMMYLENGTSWDGGGITQRVRTGDFFPSQNMWDETVIRKIKLLTEKFESATETDVLDIYHYPNTETAESTDVVWTVDSVDEGVDVAWEDTGDTEWTPNAMASINISQEIGARRLLNVILDANKKGWAHAFEFVITTTTIAGGFRPVQWGIQYRVEKKDDKASTG